MTKIRCAGVVLAAMLSLVVTAGSAAGPSTVVLAFGDAVRIPGERWMCEEPTNLGGTAWVDCGDGTTLRARFEGRNDADLWITSKHSVRVRRTRDNAAGYTYTYTFALRSLGGAPQIHEATDLAPGQSIAFPDHPQLFCNYVTEPRSFTCYKLQASKACALVDDPLTCLSPGDTVLEVIDGRTLQVTIDRPARTHKLGDGLTLYCWGPLGVALDCR
ncbi:MAG TPA: hypothetical protein VGM80_13455 [Gaiellaceae bacterium]|jgi:hypothetical protein